MKNLLYNRTISKMLIHSYNNQPICITYSNEITNLYTEKNEFSVINDRLCNKNGDPVKFKKNDLQWNYDTKTIKCVNTNYYLTINQSGYIDITDKEISYTEIFKYEIYRLFIASYNGYSIGISKKGYLTHHEAYNFEFWIDNGYLCNKIDGDKIKFSDSLLKWDSVNNAIYVCDFNQYINVDSSGNLYKIDRIEDGDPFLNTPHLNLLAKFLFHEEFPNTTILHNNSLSSQIVDDKSYLISKKINQWIVNHVVYDLHGTHPHGVSKYVKDCLEIHQMQVNKTNCIVSCAFNVGAGIHAQYDGLPALRTGVVNAIPSKYKKELEHTKYLIIVMIRPEEEINNSICGSFELNGFIPSKYENYINSCLEVSQKYSNDSNSTIKCNFKICIDNCWDSENVDIKSDLLSTISQRLLKKYQTNNIISVILEPHKNSDLMINT